MAATPVLFDLYEYEKNAMIFKNDDVDTLSRYLSEGLDPNEEINWRRGHSNSLLWLAIKFEAKKIFDVLLSDSRTNVNPNVDHLSNIPLIRAIKNNNIYFVRRLLEKGANVNFSVDEFEYEKDTPLGYAITRQKNQKVYHLKDKAILIEIIKMLISSGADVNQSCNSEGLRPLHKASKIGDTEIAQLLLNAPGIDINIRTKKGETPLMFAASKKRFQMLFELLKAGADANLLTEKNESALLFALTRTKIRKYLEESDYKENTRKTVYLLLLHTDKTILNTPSLKNRTPLHYAARYYDYWMVTTLLQSGADPTLSDESGIKASWLAFNAGKVLEAELIIQYEYGIIP